MTRRFLTPATLPPLPLPPIDPDIDLDDRSVLIAANEQAEDNEPSSTTETTNLKVVPFHGHRHQTILPIPPSINEQVEEENSSGEEDVRDRILIPASIEPPDSRPTELLVPANSDEIPPQTILVPTESDSRNIEFIPIGESDRSAKESDSGGMPPSIRPPSSHRPPTTQQPSPSHHRHKVKIKRPKPFEIVSPPPTVRRPSRIIEPSTEFVQEELESDELVPVVEPIAEPTIILPSHHRYATVPKLVEKPQTIEKPRIVERPKSLERAEYFQTKRPSIVLPPKKTRKIYKVYRPDVVEVDQGPFPSSHRPIYVAKRPPILVEQIEIPAELIESLQQYSTPAPKVFERTTLRKGSGQFVPRRSSSYRRYKNSLTIRVIWSFLEHTDRLKQQSLRLKKQPQHNQLQLYRRLLSKGATIRHTGVCYSRTNLDSSQLNDPTQPRFLLLNMSTKSLLHPIENW